MIKHKSTNLDLADSTEINTTFQPPTGEKGESLPHHNTEKSTLTTDGSFRTLDQQSEPVVCAMVGKKSLSLETQSESNKKMKTLMKWMSMMMLMMNKKEQF